MPAPAVPITDALTELLPLTIRELSQESHRAERALSEALRLSHRSSVGENLQYLALSLAPSLPEYPPRLIPYSTAASRFADSIHPPGESLTIGAAAAKCSIRAIRAIRGQILPAFLG